MASCHLCPFHTQLSASIILAVIDNGMDSTVVYTLEQLHYVYLCHHLSQCDVSRAVGIPYEEVGAIICQWGIQGLHHTAVI